MSRCRKWFSLTGGKISWIRRQGTVQGGSELVVHGVAAPAFEAVIVP